jgi:hypothetical protein
VTAASLRAVPEGRFWQGALAWQAVRPRGCKGLRLECAWARGACWMQGGAAVRAGGRRGGAAAVAACARGAGVVAQNEAKWAREAYCLEGARGAAVRAAGCWRWPVRQWRAVRAGLA